ncbi:MAG: hypothetical protein IKN48_02550 [Bacteroidaceae bacterium]|nr:hypothetical protein [Bacteroidaceae bacterium]
MDGYNMNRHYLGSEEKYALSIDCEGFSMDTDPWTAYVTGGSGKQTFRRGENTVTDGNGQWYIIIDTTKLGVGMCYLTAEFDVPDHDFPDSYRRQILQMEEPLCQIIPSRLVVKKTHECHCPTY